MTSTAIILYGSRARGEARDGADVDIIAAEPSGSIGRPNDVNGVSLHLYPQPWLVQEARTGNLFVYHVAFEGVPLLDKLAFIKDLRESFRFKLTYAPDIEIADRVARAILAKDWGFDDLLRRRYFWAIRTILIARTAQGGIPVFSSKALELFSKVKGLSAHIDNRATAEFEDCVRIGNTVLSRWGVAPPNVSYDDLLRWLTDGSEIGRDTVRLIETREASEIGDLRFYL
jgi:hypothetical protein